MERHDFAHLLIEDPGTSAVNQAGQRKVTFDMTNRRVADPPAWRRVLGNYKTFLVRTAQDPDAFVDDRVEVVLTDYEGDAVPLRLQLDYRASCMPADVERMVETLAGEADIRKVVHRSLQIWVEEFARERTNSFIDNLQAHALELKEQLKARALRQLGLTLMLRIKLSGQDGLRPHEVGPKEISARVQNQHAKVRLRFEVVYLVQPTALGKAAQHLSQLDRLEARTVQTITEVLEKEVTLDQFHRDLGGQVAAAIRSRLEDLAQEWGREVGHLHLENLSPPQGVVESYESKHEFSRNLAEYPDPIQLRTTFLLVLQDLGLYLAAGSPSLETWARQSVEEAAREVLFSARYTELVRNVENKKEEIKLRMAQRARDIGYDIRQFIAITNLQVDLLREPFVVVTDEKFPTSMVGVLAGLEIRTSARIPEMARIEAMLNRRENVIAAMSASVRDHVADVLSGIDPEEFYLYFATPMPARSTPEGRLPLRDDSLSVNAVNLNLTVHPAPRDRGGDTLERHLRRGMTSLLAEKFGAEVSQIIFRESGDAIGSLLRELRKDSKTFEVFVEPRGGKHLPAVFEMRVIVKAVDRQGWSFFLAKQPDMNVIVDALKTALSGRLSEVVPAQLYKLSSSQLLPHLNLWATERIGREFGLNVELTDLNRRLTAEERVTQNVALLAVETQGQNDREQIGHSLAVKQKEREAQLNTADSLSKQLEGIQNRLLSAADLDAGEREDLLKREQQVREQMDQASKQSDGTDMIASVLTDRGITLESGTGLPAMPTAPLDFEYVSLLPPSSGKESRE